jgi:NTP pyrophosphatase (non-canonical NTP hydrolase)
MADNRDRANRASDVLDYLASTYTHDSEEALLDLLTDLMHYCNQSSQDFDVAISRARQRFEEELQ